MTVYFRRPNVVLSITDFPQSATTPHPGRPTAEELGYESFNCMVSIRNTIGPNYVLDIGYREYAKSNADNLQVWLTLRPACESVADNPFRSKSLLDKLDDLENAENRQYQKQYQERKYKDADLEGLK